MTSLLLLRSAAAAGAIALALSACGGDDEPGAASSVPGGATTTTGAGGAAAAPAATDKVEVVGFSFKPQKITVKAGTTVTWTFQDDSEHSVEPVGASELTPSSELKGGATYPFTFTKPGTVDYRCGIHNSMTGSVVVTA